ncbi:MAG: DUF1566 domain-containing protein [Nitrospiraceae bacterium]
MRRRLSFEIVLVTAFSLCGWGALCRTAADTSQRFTLVLEDQAVADTKTGLTWEQEPDRIHDVWDASIARCATKTIGGRKGWRAPSVDELKTLIDPDQRDPALPPGHPFSNIKSEIYWTATPHPNDDIVAWQVSFFSGEPVTDQKSGMRRMWCVLAQTKE